MTSPLDPPFLVLYASIGGAIWFAIAARRRGCLAALSAVATISFFNGTLIAALGAGHFIAVVNRAVSGQGSGPGGAFAYDFRFYALALLGMLLIAGGVGCFTPARGLTRGETRAWKTALWSTVALLVVNVPLIPVQGLALSPFLIVNLVVLMVTRQRDHLPRQFSASDVVSGRARAVLSCRPRSPVDGGTS